MESLPKTASEARELGCKHYYTGKPCKYGHVSRRVTVSKCCEVCVNAASSAWKQRNPERHAKNVKNFRYRNIDEVRRRDRESQKAKRHARGLKKTGCRDPFNRLTLEQFVALARAVHGDKFSYLGPYKGKHQDTQIVCPTHGEFKQRPNNHLQGTDCPKCAMNGTSKQETELFEYCKSIWPDAESRAKGLIFNKRSMEIDIWIPSIKLAIEYCGLYWHSTQNCDHKTARLKHLVKYKKCQEAGIRLLTIYSDEWLNRRPQIELLLAGADGKLQKVHARDCVVGKEDCRQFLNDNHIQGASKGVSYTLAIRGEVVAAMTFSLNASARGQRRWELVRYATSKRVAGGASRLMSAFIKEHQPEEIWSYSDNRYFDGGMYPALGFKLDGEIGPDYRVVWPAGHNSSHKSLFRRAMIQKRLNEAGSQDVFDAATDPRSEWEVCDQNGFGRIYDCGKKRWVWRKPDPSP